MKTGMAIIVLTTPTTQRELRQALTACSAVVAVSTMLLTAACLIAATIVPATVTAISASASSASLS